MIQNDVRRGFNEGSSEQMLTGGADFNYRFSLGRRELKNLEAVVGFVAPNVLQEFGEVAKEVGGGWLDIKDEDDERGRVGTGFPWQK